MTRTVKVLCYKSKTLSNGEHPLMLFVCKDNKRKYQSLGISVSAEHWDFKNNRPNDNCPNRDEIRFLIQQKLKRLSSVKDKGKGLYNFISTVANRSRNSLDVGGANPRYAKVSRGE